MPFGPDGWYEATTPIEVEGGLRARSRRGTIGEQWWSRRFIDILEEICDAGRLTRGRSYARKGQVVSLDLGPGEVRAVVQGSRPEPYEVTVEIEAYDDAMWADVERALAAQAVYRAKLLAGEMPVEIVDVFDELGIPLFPSELDMECTCPDWGFPCKHLSAALYLLAEAFDDDPFLVLAWRGRAKAELLESLSGAVEERAASDPLRVDDVPLSESVGDFYSPGAPLGRLRTRPAATTTPDILLRALEPPAVRVRHIPLLDILRPVYRGFTEPADQPRR
ncbi:SWIM zinc finger family protein [Spongiactinospora sp. TRM90649]|uniref:SWIM zinc finger family protein n=1 Tax=Spongiactinospora sp. TRM90649 TaxID=3031114 RepID=UPI0023FA37C6|nr:SWIM zinc finger family protein [Spongiactinospora sp. TRM90649]MDF5759150.1 SWIM zinc finger family protein [Spongiactinospora sp. TRM90649]